MVFGGYGIYQQKRDRGRMLGESNEVESFRHEGALIS